MAVIWNLSLSANSANEVTKINEYAKRLTTTKFIYTIYE